MPDADDDCAPHCPYTRTSIGEMVELMAHSGGHLYAVMIFANPANFGDDWLSTDLWVSAAKIPGVSSMKDDGSELKRSGADNSDDTMVL
jgi:hypothetical protein